jgi:hypothetical protein
MSQVYDNTNKFILFPNKRKETEKHPDLAGTININGVDHWFNAWVSGDPMDGGYVRGTIGKEKTGGKAGGNSSGGQTQRPRGNLKDNMPSRQSADDDSDIPW